MLYRVAKLFMTIALRLFYRRVYATGLETIPDTGPVIMVANHPSSLMDAALIGILLKRSVHFFTRGDVFINRFASRLLSALHLIPVYDHAGKSSLHDNKESFDKAVGILKNGGLVLFFPEGSSHVDRKLLPLKKGAFRLGFQSASAISEEQPFYLIPVGINYAHPMLSQADVIVHVGTPLIIHDYRDKFKLNPSNALLQIKNHTEKELAKYVLHIESDERLRTADICLEINRNDYHYYTTHWMQATIKRLEEERKLCSAINQLGEAEATTLHSEVISYALWLDEQKLTDECFTTKKKSLQSAEKKLIAGFPVFLVSYTLNALPVLIAKRIAGDKVSRADFYSWIFLTSAAFLYFCWIIILFLGFLVIGLNYALVIVMITLVLGPFTVFYLNLLQKYRRLKRYRRLKKNDSDLLEKMKAQREYISDKLRRMIVDR